LAHGEWFALVRALGNRVVHLVPNWILRKLYPLEYVRQKILILPAGTGPLFYVTPGRPLRIDAVQLKVVNLLPFPVDLESIEGEILIESNYVTNVSKVPALTINRTCVGDVYWTLDLSDNQAAIVRGYPTDCPQFKMRGAANLRGPYGKFTLQIQVEMRSFVYK